MRKFNLGGWLRIGIVLSVIWIVIGGSFGWNHAYDGVDANFKQCVTAMKSAADLQACRDARNNALAVPRGVSAAIVALISSKVRTPMRDAGGRSDGVTTSAGSSVRA